MKKRLFVLFLALLTALGTVIPAYGTTPASALDTEKAQTENGIKVFSDLNGKKIGVQTGVLYEEAEYNGSGASIKETITGEEWRYYKMPNDLIPALQKHKIDAYLIEEVGYYAQRYQHPELSRLEEAAGYCDFAVIVGNNSKQQTLYKQIQEYIKAKKEDGWLDDLFDYWVKNWNPETCVMRSKPVSSGENGEVIIAIEGGYEPFSFMDGNLEFSGFDVEFMTNFCAAYGYTPVFKAMEFDSIAIGAISGKYDFGMNIVVDEERAEASVLSDPYYRCDLVFVVNGEDTEELGFFARISSGFYKTFIKDNRWKLFCEGIGVTMLITLCSIILGTLLGFILYLMCRHGNKLANGFTSALNGLVEGIPTVVFLMILAFVVFGRSDLDVTWISVIGFTFIFGAGMYDMLCVGCNAISKGQTEASRALGYSDKQSFFKIILPQAARHFLPIYKNSVVSLIKETSVVGYIAVMDLTKQGDIVRGVSYEAFFSLIAVAVVYFVLEALLIFLVKRVQVAVDPSHRTKEQIFKDIDTSEWE